MQKNNRFANGTCVHFTTSILSNSAKFYGYLNLLKDTQKGKELKERFEVTARNRTRDLSNRKPNCASSCFEKEENVSCFKAFKVFVCAVAPVNGRSIIFNGLQSV